MTTKIYINNTLIDYSENQNLPFILRVAYRDFRKIGETESVDIDNAATSLTIPATKTNKEIFEGNESTFFNIDVLRNGQTFFKGRCRLANKTFNRFNLVGYSLELYVGTADLFEALEGLSLRDLDLGQIGYSDGSILATWSGLTSDDNLAIYLPCVYGKLTSGAENYFQIEDLRPSVYYETILQGIESFLGITIESNLRASDFWKRCVHLYGVGNLWENVSSDIDVNLTSDGTVDTLTYTQSSSDSIVYKVEVNVPSGNNAALDLVHLEINSDTGYSQTIIYDSTNGNNVVSAEIQLNNVGEKIELTGHKTGGSALADLPNGTQFLIKSTTKVVEGSAVKIETCLHDITVKDWLKEMFLQFNLVSFYNPVTKTLRLEPAFSFEVGGTTYDGFYRFGDEIKTLKTDSQNANKNFKPIYDQIVFSYQKNGDSEDLINRYTDHNSHPLNCIDVEINNGLNAKVFESIYTNVANGLVDGITSNELPILTDSDMKLQDGVSAITTPTFLTEPKNGLVTGEIISAFYENVNYTNMPVVRQNNLRTYKDYTLTFSDANARSGATSQTNKGLVSLFYKQYFSILSRLEVLTIDVEINNIFDIETYRNIYKINNEFYILIGVKNVSYTTNMCEGVFVKYDYIRNTDDFYTNNNPVSALQILNIT